MIKFLSGEDSPLLVGAKRRSRSRGSGELQSIRLFYELVRQRPNIKRISGFLDQKSDSVKNNEKPESYGEVRLVEGAIAGY